MEKLQFRVLYRVFLLRVVDLELLSADADPMRLIGQFLTIFTSISLLFCIPLILMSGLSVGDRWTFEHFFFETTITIAGLITVLNWDSAFPDRRDILVLGTLPVRSSTLFLAKLAALFAPPCLTIAGLNAFTGLAYPMLFYSGRPGALNLLRAWPAYWATVFLGGVFIVFLMLAVQGLTASLLPRQLFLRLSALLQTGAFTLLLLVYFLEPSLESSEALRNPVNQTMLAWLPSYWFLGLFNQLNGSLTTEMAPLARHAWIGLAVATAGAGLALAISYFRMLPKVVEQPEIQPLLHTMRWPFRFGRSLESAITLFSLRTLLRSRQHRMILSFYVGIGLAIVVGYARSPVGRFEAQKAGITATSLLASTLAVILTVMAIRVVVTIPIALGGNWIVRVTQVRPAANYRRAVRVSWVALGVVPVWVTIAGLLVILYPLRPVAAHLVTLFLLGVLVVELCLYSFPKIPFTCSYLPGKANLHFAFWACLMLFIQLLNAAVKLELGILHRPLAYALTITVFAAAVVGMRWWNEVTADSGDELRFEESYAGDLVSLKLQ